MTSTVTTELDTEYAELPEPRQTKSVEQSKKTVSFQLPSADESETSEEKTTKVMDDSSFANLVNQK